MKLHANAALSLNQRRRLAGRVVEEGWSLTGAATPAGVSERTARKWVARYRAEGQRATPRDQEEAAAVTPRTRPVDAESRWLGRRDPLTGQAQIHGVHSIRRWVATRE
jgi:transposase-like protein